MPRTKIRETQGIPDRRTRARIYALARCDERTLVAYWAGTPGLREIKRVAIRDALRELGIVDPHPGVFG